LFAAVAPAVASAVAAAVASLPHSPLSFVCTCTVAPEMARSGQTRANKKVDVWSLGLIFLELATGAVLDDEVDIKLTTSKKWLTAKLNTIPDQYTCKKPLSALIASCLHTNPDERCSMNDIIVSPLVAVHTQSSNNYRRGPSYFNNHNNSNTNKNKALRTLKNVVGGRGNGGRLVAMGKGGMHRKQRHVPQSVPLNNRAQTRLLSPTGVFDRPDVPIKRQKVKHMR